MSDLILHHYAMSPFAEKIRLALGLKDLFWRSVDTPMVLPKPDHFELTGGYRRVPVLQVGADVYCDTHLIARVLDRIQPAPPLAPPGLETVEHAFSRWAETSFMMAILAFFGIGGIFPEEFVEDRTKTMVPPGQDVSAAKMILGSKLVQLRANLARLEHQLSDGRPFMLGDEPCGADFSAYHPVMALAMAPQTASLREPFARVNAWCERVGAVGHGKREDITAADAIAVARDASPAPFDGEPVTPDGIALGTPVVVLPDEYGSGNVAGELAPSGLHEIAVRRRTERAGEVVVHFPREDYAVIATG
ncbi:MAG: glutathione S-transferase family protein [Myxococcota bacterium]